MSYFFIFYLIENDDFIFKKIKYYPISGRYLGGSHNRIVYICCHIKMSEIHERNKKKL